MDQFKNHPLYRLHTIDTAMSNMWNFYKSRFLVLFLTSLVMSLMTQLISVQINLGDIQNTTNPMELLEKYKGFILPFSEMLIISLVFSVFMQYYVMYNPLEGHPNIFVSAWISLKYIPSYIIILILFCFMGAAAMTLGVLVFIIGMFFALFWIATIYMFILPVLMAEGTNIGKAIARIFKLAHRKFWTNLAWLLILFIIILVITFILSGLTIIPFSGNLMKLFKDPSEAIRSMSFTSNPIYIFLSAVVSALVAPLIPIFSSILYLNAIANEDVSLQVTAPDEPSRVRVEDLYAKPYSDDHPDNPEKKQQNTSV
ncbi:MAG: hypothetical protein ABSG89_13665 [Bacteroidales bacterium]